MSAQALIGYLVDIGYLAVFLLASVTAVRQPSRARVDTALFFGATAAVIVAALVLEVTRTDDPPRLIVAAESALIMALPYLLLRLAHDFAQVPRWLLRVSGSLTIVIAASLFVVPDPYPAAYALALVACFAAGELYAATRFVNAARRAAGVTRRRLQAVALGSLLLGMVIVIAGCAIIAPAAAGLWTSLSSAVALGSGISYYIGFAAPSFLRRAWRADDLRKLMSTAASLDATRDPFSPDEVASLERNVAAIIGAPRAMVILWDPIRQQLVAGTNPAPELAVDRERTIAYRVYRDQQAIFVPDAIREDPINAAAYRRAGATTLLGAPISNGDRRLGVLVAFGRQSSLFADDDLLLLRILAGQVATFLVLRELLATITAVRGREEANRLKEDFLSAAAHDLKTPLTTLLGQSQLMRRRLSSDPPRMPDLASVDRMVEEAERMRSLIDDLLDAARSEQGTFIGRLSVLDLQQVATEVVRALDAPDHRVVVCGEPAPVLGDLARLRQVVQNLVDNAVKYTPGGGQVTLTTGVTGDQTFLDVADTGVGIPASELESIFERFQRGARTHDRRFAGMGVGLYLCKRIVEEHGARIWAESSELGGSCFHVVFARHPMEANS